MFGPAGMSSALVNKLSALSADMAKAPEVTSKVSSLGLVFEGAGIAPSRARMAALAKQYQDALAAGIRMK